MPGLHHEGLKTPIADQADVQSEFDWLGRFDKHLRWQCVVELFESFERIAVNCGEAQRLMIYPYLNASIGRRPTLPRLGPALGMQHCTSVRNLRSFRKCQPKTFFD